MNTSDAKCKNCGNSVEANYCSYCGQSTKTERIDLPYLFHNLIYSFFHIDKGILYTMKELTLRPGKAIRDYLDGKRVGLFKPFSYLLIPAAIYVFIYIGLDLPVYYSNVYTEEIPEIDALGESYANWINNHLGIAQLILIPVVAFFSFVLFRKSGYNYGENLVINTYIGGHALLLSIVVLPFMYLLNYLGYGKLVVFSPLATLVEIAMICSVFNMYSITSRIIRAILCVVLQYVVVFLVISIFLIFSLLRMNDFSLPPTP